MSLLLRGLILVLAACGLQAAFLRPALAQGSDALPSLDESAPIVVEPPPPEPVVLLQTPAQKAASNSIGPIRARRRLALLGEVGWNGIAGFGPTLTYHVDPHFSIDLGAGLSLMGWKVGLRGRYNLLTGPLTPFLGVGMLGAAGFGDSPIPISNSDDDPMRVPLNITIRPSSWLQTVVGVDWIAKSGFNLVACTGYAFLLSRDPVHIVSGEPNADERQAFDIIYRSNLVVTVALGYSFR